MSGQPSNTQSGARAIEAVLVSLGFARGADGTLSAPTDSVITFVPIGQFLELRIAMDGSIAVTAVLHGSALKFCRAEVKP